jgi:DNA-binding transcriptional ArsR family regulator
VINDALVALADPTRRRCFELIVERPRPVGELAGQMPVSRPAVSQHLKVLRLAGLVHEDRVGTRHVYSVDLSGLEALRSYFDSFWQRSLTAFKAAVEQSHPSEHLDAEEAP